MFLVDLIDEKGELKIDNRPNIEEEFMNQINSNAMNFSIKQKDELPAVFYMSNTYEDPYKVSAVRKISF